MAEINWDFIAQPGIEGESTHKTGYVPQAGKSGFTVGSVDIGQMSGGKFKDIWTMLQKHANKMSPNNIGDIRLDIYDKLNPFAGRKNVTNKEARQIKFEDSEINYITQAARGYFEDRIKEKEGWNKLDIRSKTVLASVGWQYGLNSEWFEKLWKEKGNKKNMSAILDLYGENEYSGRSKMESDYLNSVPREVQEITDLERKDNFLTYQK